MNKEELYIKRNLRNVLFNLFSIYDEKIKTKFKNISEKTGQYNVPDELFQKRTHRKNRVLIPWKDVKNNNLTMEMLETFSGGVTVDFINNDFFDEDNEKYLIFNQLKKRLGSDEKVSSIISIKSEAGSSSSFIQRNSFNKLIGNTKVFYNGNCCIIDKDNYKNFYIRKVGEGNIGNDKWEGFLYISIRGGQQDTLESHKNNDITVFNPACEFATEEISLDLDLVLAYFAMKSINSNDLSLCKKDESYYSSLIEELETCLQNSKYSNDDFQGDLLSYCKNHPSLKMAEGKLYDPIQVEEINIRDFKEDKIIDLTHNEAVNLAKYYWDNEKKCVLTPARPTNVFWSKHLSNMMQQDFTLEEYFKREEEIVRKRKELLKK